MTDAKVLADALVEVGIGDKAYSPYHYYVAGAGLFEADEFITNWRIAGKVLELIATTGRYIDMDRDEGEWEVMLFDRETDKFLHAAMGKSLPRAVIEAWYAATEQGESDDSR